MGRPGIAEHFSISLQSSNVIKGSRDIFAGEKIFAKYKFSYKRTAHRIVYPEARTEVSYDLDQIHAGFSCDSDFFVTLKSSPNHKSYFYLEEIRDSKVLEKDKEAIIQSIKTNCSKCEDIADKLIYTIRNNYPNEVGHTLCCSDLIVKITYVEDQGILPGQRGLRTLKVKYDPSRIYKTKNLFSCLNTLTGQDHLADVCKNTSFSEHNENLKQGWVNTFSNKSILYKSLDKELDIFLDKKSTLGSPCVRIVVASHRENLC